MKFLDKAESHTRTENGLVWHGKVEALHGFHFCREMMVSRFRSTLEMVKTTTVLPVVGANFDQEKRRRLPRWWEDRLVCLLGSIQKGQWKKNLVSGHDNEIKGKKRSLEPGGVKGRLIFHWRGVGSGRQKEFFWRERLIHEREEENKEKERKREKKNKSFEKEI